MLNRQHKRHLPLKNPRTKYQERLVIAHTRKNQATLTNTTSTERAKSLHRSDVAVHLEPEVRLAVRRGCATKRVRHARLT